MSKLLRVLMISVIDNIIQFGVEEIEKAVNSLNKSQTCDCNGFNLYLVCSSRNLCVL